MEKSRTRMIGKKGASEACSNTCLFVSWENKSLVILVTRWVGRACAAAMTDGIIRGGKRPRQGQGWSGATKATLFLAVLMCCVQPCSLAQGNAHSARTHEHGGGDGAREERRQQQASTGWVGRLCETKRTLSLCPRRRSSCWRRRRAALDLFDCGGEGIREASVSVLSYVHR